MFSQKNYGQMGFGPYFLPWIHLIYSTQTAEIALDGDLSNKRFLLRGIRQGWPLLPLLCNMMIETMVISVHLKITYRASLQVGQFTNEPSMLMQFSYANPYTITSSSKPNSVARICGYKINENDQSL